MSSLVIIFIVISLQACGVLTNQEDENRAILDKLDLSIKQVDSTSLILSAAKQGDAALLKQALAKGESVNSYNTEGSAFALAVINDHRAIANILMAAGADWELGFDQLNSSALIESARHGNNEIVKKLIIREVDINQLDEDGYSALAVAAIEGHLTTLKILINAGAESDVYPSGQSILMHVVADNNMLIAQQLIAAGTDLDFRDENDDTALKIARRNGYFDLDLMLVQAGAQP